MKIKKLSLMRKEYSQPRIEVVRMETCQMIAGSESKTITVDTSQGASPDEQMSIGFEDLGIGDEDW